MEKRLIPTPRQYLTDIIANSMINEAIASGDQAYIAAQKARYSNLSEDEVIYSSEIRNPITGKYRTTMTVPPRGFKLPSVNFRTGAVEKMLDPNAEIVDFVNTLTSITKPGFYYVKDVNRYHLVCNQELNIWEALKLTGYEFDIKSFKFVQYATGFDEITVADGHVDITCPIVEGRLMVTYLKKSAPAPQEEPVVKSMSTEEQVEKVSEETKEPAEPVNESAPVEETTEEQKTPVQQKKKR